MSGTDATTLVAVLTGVLNLVLVLTAWSRRSAPGGRIAILNAAVVALFWCWPLAAQIGAPGLAAKLFWQKMRFLGVAILPVTFLAQVLECTGRGGYLTRRRVALLAVVPALATLAVWTSEGHELAFHHVRLVSSGAASTLEYDVGAALKLDLAFAVACGVAAAALLADTALAGAPPYRAQALALLVVLAIPWLWRLAPWPSAPPLLLSPGVHPVVFVPASLIMWIAVFRFGLLDLVPVARGVLVERWADAIVVLDRQDRVIDLNPAAARLTERSVREAVGRRAREVFGAWPGWAPLADLLARGPGAATRAEVRLGEGPGEQVLEASLTPLAPDRGGLPRGRMVLLHDVTERARVQAELADAKRAAEAASAAKGEFLARMSHEVRTPLSGILGLAELLLASPLQPEQRRRAAALQRSGRVLLAVLDDVLDASRLEAGRLELAGQDFDPRRLVGDVVELFSGEAQAKGLRLEASVAAEVPPVLHGDPTRVHQALANLVANALKFTAEGRVLVAAGATLLGPGAVRMRFEVADTGPGVPAEAQPRLFQAFTQADSSVAGRFGGSGLGLAICRQLAELMGGTAGVSSEAGRGATFWFTARFDLGPALPQEAEEAGGPCYSGRVLLADDQPVNRMVLEGLLERFGCRVEQAADGPEALARATGPAPYDLILLDVQMPGLDGLTVAAEIRRREGRDRHTPVVVLSASAPPGCHEDALAAGADDSLVKPVTGSALAALLERFLARDPASPAVPLGMDGGPPGAPLPEFRDAYLRDAAASLASLRTSLAAGDDETVRREAHRLKGSSLFLGATRLAELCEHLGRPGGAEAEPAAASCVAEMERELARLEAASR